MVDLAISDQRPQEPRRRVRCPERRPTLPRVEHRDSFTRACLAAVVDISLSGVRVVRELAEVIARRSQASIPIYWLMSLAGVQREFQV